MSRDWSSLSEEARAAVQEIVGDLLHDWIKYMEMRLLSVDWSAPPESVERIVDRAIRLTRRHGDEVRSVGDLWEAGRSRLVEAWTGGPVEALIADLEIDVAELEGLLAQDRAALSRDPEGIEALIRRPGRRLRTVRDTLDEASEPCQPREP